MKKFWGFYSNGKYKVGCNGTSVYIFDSQDNQLAVFKDIKYAYCGAFKPDSDIFAVKSASGELAIYNLEKLCLIKKIFITDIGQQDEGFAFSPDGKYFYNIEKPENNCRTQLTEYRTEDFSISQKYFSNRDDIHIENLEFDSDSGKCYILGFFRNKKGIFKKITFDFGFIGQFCDADIINVIKLSESEYKYLSDFKKYENSGFTQKSLEWSELKNCKEIKKITLKEVYESAI